jgi:two-component system cell cycle response regulator
VDDNPTNLKLACDVLEFEGYHILRAVDAEETVSVIANCPPDLILMDVALPGMDGLTLTRKLKADDKTKHILVVMLSAFAMVGDDQKAMDAGGDGYITKPIDTRKLPATVAEFLKRIESPSEETATKILIVEDHPLDLKLAHHVLAAAGHDVREAMDAEQAAQAIKNDKPQVILLDLNLKGGDGLAFVRKLKTDEETRDIVIIAATSFPEKYSQAAVMEAGCAVYLLKPINTRTLPAEIIQAFKQSTDLTAMTGRQA